MSGPLPAGIQLVHGCGLPLLEGSLAAPDPGRIVLVQPINLEQGRMGQGKQISKLVLQARLLGGNSLKPIHSLARPRNCIQRLVAFG
ncbi:MAG: hypothetical protein MJD61_21750 [Proteobacteria bacterium]|nr:hypothetical protein [Pseudomonadota bacterium]